MKDEIKEILECLEKYGQLTPDAIDDLHYIRDYITNLQEENEILKEQNVCVGCNNNPDYKSRIDKAIEYIKNEWYELNTRDIEHCINLNKDIRIDLLNILQGSVK